MTNEDEVISECWKLVDEGIATWVGDPPHRPRGMTMDEFLGLLRDDGREQEH